MIKVEIHGATRLPIEETWAFVEAGDIISYVDGSSFFVESFAIEEADGSASMCVRCIVGPENIEWEFGQAGILGINKRIRRPTHITVTKGLR